MTYVVIASGRLVHAGTSHEHASRELARYSRDARLYCGGKLLAFRVGPTPEEYGAEMRWQRAHGYREHGYDGRRVWEPAGKRTQRTALRFWGRMGPATEARNGH